MDPEDLLPRKKTNVPLLGEDLSAMSEFELSARIMSLEEEIARCRQAIAARRSTKSNADAYFKK